LRAEEKDSRYTERKAPRRESKRVGNEALVNVLSFVAGGGDAKSYLNLTGVVRKVAEQGGNGAKRKQQWKRGTTLERQNTVGEQNRAKNT